MSKTRWTAGCRGAQKAKEEKDTRYTKTIQKSTIEAFCDGTRAESLSGEDLLRLTALTIHEDVTAVLKATIGTKRTIRVVTAVIKMLANLFIIRRM